MLITVIKRNSLGQNAITATKKCGDFEEFVTFTTQMGVDQDFEDLIQDFTEGFDRTYIIPLVDGAQV